MFCAALAEQRGTAEVVNKVDTVTGVSRMLCLSPGLPRHVQKDFTLTFSRTQG